MKYGLEIKIEDGEFWYGGVIDDTLNMPYGTDTQTYVNPFEKIYVNQINPVLLSSTGRYVYAKEYFAYEIKDGKIFVRSNGKIKSGKKESFAAAQAFVRDTYFPMRGGAFDPSLFIRPQYCTWMALGYDQTQERVLAFARGVLEAGLPAGELIIDDGWSDYYGDWTFSKYKFPDPKGMCKELKELGFTVVLWICPYVSPDSPVFRELRAKGVLLQKNGKPYLAEWWDGFSACVDFTNPDGRGWFTDRVNDLIALGVAGMKMDGGDAYIYGNDVDCYVKKGASGVFLAEAYSEAATAFKIAELRGAAKCAGTLVWQRIADRTHAWEDSLGGFDGIVKKSIVMGLVGYPFNCPDMIGGGLMADWGKEEDEELNIRYMQAAALMPSLQFSKPLWTYGERTKNAVLDMLKLREKYLPLLLLEAEKSAVTGEPILKPLILECGQKGATMDEFIIGEKLLVAPVIKKGQTERVVYLPKGKWLYMPTGEIFDGEQEVTVPAPLNVLPHFEKV